VKQEPEGNPVPNAVPDSQIAGLVGQIGCLVVAVLLVTLVGGIWLDRTLNTRPAFTLILVLGSMPVTFYLLYRIAVQAVSKGRPAGAPDAKDRNGGGEA
jgi:F0F1-type ATP synthase assembly protein I